MATTNGTTPRKVLKMKMKRENKDRVSDGKKLGLQRDSAGLHRRM